MRITLCLCTLALLGTTACSGMMPTTPDPVVPVAATPSTATVEAVVRTVLSDLVNGVNTTKNRRSSVSSPILLSGPQSITCNANGTQCQLFEQLEDRQGCITSGSKSMSATLSGTITATTNSSSGSLRWDAYQSFSDCTENGWVTNSNPYMSSGGSIRINVNGNSSRTTMTLTLGGGFVMTNAPGRPAGRLVCANSGVILQWDELTGWSNSGSLTCDNGLSFKY